MTLSKAINVAGPVSFLLECNDSLGEGEVSCVMVAAAVFYFLSVTLVFNLSFRRA